LAVGSVVGFQGIQLNARRTIINTDAHSIATAANQVITGGGTIAGTSGKIDINGTSNDYVSVFLDPVVLVFTVPASGIKGKEDIFVYFDTKEQMERAAHFVQLNSIDVAGVQRFFADVDTEGIQTWRPGDTIGTIDGPPIACTGCTDPLCTDCTI
jgi:hypothetical protein